VQEFHRLRSGMRAKQEHALLLEDFREFDRTRLDLEDGVGSADQALLREHASISRNTGQVHAKGLFFLRYRCVLV
jgi:Golgi SNAP receptor complex protein 1